MLSDSLERMLAERYGFEQRQGYMKTPDGFSRACWQQYAELGLLGLPFAEQDGGFGGGPVELMIVAEAFGRALVLEPFLSTVLETPPLCPFVPEFVPKTSACGMSTSSPTSARRRSLDSWSRRML